MIRRLSACLIVIMLLLAITSPVSASITLIPEGYTGSFSQSLSSGTETSVASVPAGVKDLSITLDGGGADLDIRLYDADSNVELIVYSYYGCAVGHTPTEGNASSGDCSSLGNHGGAVSLSYESMTISYSGWYGTDGDRGHETLIISGHTTRNLAIKVYAFSAGTATLSYTYNQYLSESLAPDAPTGVSAVAGDGQATVSFTAPASNGSAFTHYTVTASPGGVTATGTGTSIVVGGLTNGTAYTFTVTATNGVGTSSPSLASNSVTPAAPTPAPTGTYLQVHFDQTEYEPGDVAAVTVMAHGYPAGLSSVTAELRYDSHSFGQPSLSTDFVSGGLMEGGTQLQPIYVPGGVAINLSNPSGTAADSGTGGKLFTLHFPVLATAADTTGAWIGFTEVTGLAPSGVLLLDVNDNQISTSTNVDGYAAIALGGDIAGMVTLQSNIPQNYAGVTVKELYHEVSTVTNASGSFTIPDLLDGVYDLRFSKPGYLTTTVYNVAVVRGHVTNLAAEGISLIPGNIQDVTGLNPDTVFLEDLAGLARAIGSLSSTTGMTAFSTTWNAAADLDGDRSVGASDLALLAQNWGLIGSTGPGTPAAGTEISLMPPVQGATTLTVSATPSSVQHTDTVQLQAVLSTTSGVSVAYKQIEFMVNGHFISAATDATGTAVITVNTWASAGTASFDADFYGDPLLAPASALGLYTVTAEDAQLHYHGPDKIVAGFNYIDFDLIPSDDGTYGDVSDTVVLVVATPLDGGSVVSGTGAVGSSGQGSVGLTLEQKPYSITLSVPAGQNFTATPLTRSVGSASSLTLMGPTSGEAGTQVSFKAQLSPAVSGKNINFQFDGSNFALVQTDAMGYATATYTLPAASGTYSVRAEFFGDTTLGASSTTMSILVTEPAVQQSLVEFHIMDSSGAGMSGATVDIVDAYGSVMDTTTSDASGTATFYLPDGTFTVSVTASGYDVATQSFTVPAASTINVTLTPTTTGGSETTPTITVFFESEPGVATTTATLGDFVWVIGDYGAPLTDTFTFEYMGPNDTSFTLMSSSNATSDGATADLFDTTGLATGTYTFRVTDSQGVSGTATLEIVAAGATSTTTVVDFHVLDGNSQSLSGATVTVTGLNVSTSTNTVNGGATFDLPDGTYSYEVTASGFNTVTGTFSVPTDISIPVSLTPTASQTTSLQFHVMDGSSTGIASATMTISGSGTTYTQTTDGSGYVTFNLPDGDYTYEVSATGYDALTGSFTVPGATSPTHLTLTAQAPTAYATTFAVTQGGTAAASATVTVLDANEAQAASGETDASGQFTADLLDGTYSYTVALGSSSATGTFTVSGGSQSISVELPVAFMIRVASSCTNTYVAGASVTVHGGGQTYGPLTTNQDGQATFQLPSGSYTYDISATGFESTTGSALTVTSEGYVDANIQDIYCLESVRLYEGTHPNGVLTTTATIGGTYYVEATYVGTPPETSVNFAYGLVDENSQVLGQTLVGTATISGNKAHITWNTAGLTPGTNYILFVQTGANWDTVFAYPITVQ